jgi:hypothetical protein
MVVSSSKASVSLGMCISKMAVMGWSLQALRQSAVRGWGGLKNGSHGLRPDMSLKRSTAPGWGGLKNGSHGLVFASAGMCWCMA